MEAESGIRVLSRALDILESFSETTPEMTLMELTEKSGLSTSTVHRILRALEQREYLSRNEDTKRYSLGPRIEYLSGLTHSKPEADLRVKAREALTELRNQFDESVSLYVREDAYRVCMERMEGGQTLRSVVNIGERMSVKWGGTGKILMAGMADEELRELLGDEYDSIIKDVERARKQGYWVSNGERETGLTSIGAPVYNVAGTVIAAIGLSGPSGRMIDEHLTEKVLAVVEQARKLSRKMGYYTKTQMMPE